ncbi:hypothetical protein BP5796_12218 [Coleophoma crateriformis]|uniref:CmcJ-like methyltransferase n=1 Tax=Coleophoma crateriformis TaxID=565419 RepID=A0A3D8Q9J5_9HELO|nr:hypothetical protein BP5796_12218 [Coleophoma crateriformis]
MTVLEAKDTIETHVAYLKYDPSYENEKLFIMTYVPEGKSIADGPLPRSNCVNHLQPVQIKNFRNLQSAPSFDQCGFALEKLQPAISPAEFENSDSVEDVFYPQVEKMLAKMFPNAAHIRMLEHQIRKRHQEFPVATGVPYQDLLPTTLVHIGKANHHSEEKPSTYTCVDFTPHSTAKTSIAAFDATPQQYRRLLAVNLWKSLQGPGNDWPLALCDCRTVDYKNEIVVQDIVYEDRFTENARVYPSAKHKWYWYNNLQEDEIIVFQQCDTEVEGGRGVPHTGFYNPNVPNDVTPRVSIELRAYIYFN